MNPIDKFTNIDAVYPITDAKEEDTLLDYVWELAMLIHPALPKKVKGGAKCIALCKASIDRCRKP